MGYRRFFPILNPKSGGDPNFEDKSVAVDDRIDILRKSWIDSLWANLLDGAGAHPAAVSAIDVDSGWILDEWQRELLERLLWQARGGSVRFVESSCGGGRTHFLCMLENRARQLGMATVSVPAQLQAQVMKDPLELYRNLAQRLVPQQQTSGKGFLPLVTGTLHLDLARAELFPEFPTWGRALELWTHQRDPQAERYLLGEGLTEPSQLHAGLTSEQSILALRCLLNYLDFCGEKGLVVLCDGEGLVPETSERATLESLRNLIDSCAGGELPALLLVFGVLPLFRQSLVPEYEALQQRLHNGFSTGPAGCLRPILILEEQRAWRASLGIDFASSLFEAIGRLAIWAVPHATVAPALLRRNGQMLLSELPWDEATPGAARGLSRTIARWFAHQDLAADSSAEECYSQRLNDFLEMEAL